MLVQEGELGGGLWNKQDKGVLYNIRRLRLNKELSGISCHPQANQMAQLKTLDQNKRTTSCLLISLFRFWLWNQQVPRSHRHSHTHLVTPRLYMFKWCAVLQWAWDMRTEITAETSQYFCCLLSRQGQLLFSDLDLEPCLQSIAGLGFYSPWITKGVGSWGSIQRFGGEVPHHRHIGRYLAYFSVCEDHCVTEKLSNHQWFRKAK